MNRVTVDQKSFEYIRFIAAEPRMRYEDGRRLEEQEKNAEGVPLFAITCLAKTAGAAKPETITVKVPMEKEPTIAEFEKIGFVNLSAYAYATRGDRAQLSFSADQMGKVLYGGDASSSPPCDTSRQTRSVIFRVAPAVPHVADAVIKPFLQGVRMQTAKGVLAPFADSRLTSLWVCLCESFREARIGACKGCGPPVIAIGERGSKRQYCSDSCKRKYKRALRFASLVNDGGVDPALAAKEAGISQATALRMLERNGIEVNPAQ